MGKKKISELPSASTLDGTEYIPIVQSGATVKASAQAVGNLGGGGSGYTVVTGTLSAGSTTVTLSSNAITSTSLLAPYTDTYGINPTNMVATTGSVTLTFEAQQTSVGVAVVVLGGAS